MRVLQTNCFKKAVRLLHSNQKKDLDDAVKALIKKPSLGKMKRGDLAGIRVYKFKMSKQLMLLSYDVSPNEQTVILLSIGSHQNFYRNLKR